MLELIKKNWRILLALLLFPIIFIGILKFCIKYLPGEMIGSIDGWLGFLGGYFGVLGAVGAIWYQKEIEENTALKNLNLYSEYISNKLIPIFEKEFLIILRHYLPTSNYNFYNIQKFNFNKFDIIDSEIIDKYLPLIIANQHISDVLELKVKIKEIKNYMKYLESSLIVRSDFFEFITEQEDKDFYKYYFNLDEILTILSRNISDLYYEKNILEKDVFFNQIKFDKKNIAQTYYPLIDEIERICQKSNVTFLDLLYCYICWLSEFTNLLYMKNFYKNNQLNNKYYMYFSSCLDFAFAIEDSYKILLNLKNNNR